MPSELTLQLLDRAATLHSLLRAHGGNPNHDEHGKFASSGGHGKHHAKRARRKERLRKKWHAEAAEMKRQHKGYFKGSKADARREWKSLKKEQGRDRASARNRFGKERAKLQASHQKEYAAQKAGSLETLKEDVAVSGDKAATREEGRQRIKANLAELKTEHGKALAGQHEGHKREWGELKASQAKERQDFKAESKDTVKGLKEDVAREKKAFWDEFHADVKANGFKKGGDQSGQRSIADHDGGHQSSSGQYGSGTTVSFVSGLDGVRRLAPNAAGRFPRSQTHKASSAESIIAYCLKQRGWTGRWQSGKLTDRQRVRLLEDVRLYGRRWLRHEAEGVFDETRSLLVHEEILGRATPGEPSIDPGSISVVRATADVALPPIRRFFARAKQFVRELIHAGVMAIRGTPNLDPAEAAEADRAADIQARFFDGFENEVQGPQAPTPGRAIARAESYANSAWQASQQINHRAHNGANGRPPRKLRSGNPARWERRVLGHPKTEHCFPAGTMIETEDGERPIETIEIGDRVLTRAGYRKVARLYFGGASDLIRVSSGFRSVVSTLNHPFLTQRGWVRADELTIDDQAVFLQQAANKVDFGVALPNANNLESSGPQILGSCDVTFFLGKLAGLERLESRVAMPPVPVSLNDDIADHEIDDEFGLDQNVGLIGDTESIKDVPEFCFQSARLISLKPGVPSEEFGRKFGISHMLGGLPRKPLARAGLARRVVGSHVGGGSTVNNLASSGFGQINFERHGFVSDLNEREPKSFGNPCGPAIGIVGSQEFNSIGEPYFGLGSGRQRVATRAAGSQMALMATDSVEVFAASAVGADVAGTHSRSFESSGLHPSSGTQLYPIAIYNLEVEGEHEYVANGFLVHNCDDCPPLAALGWQPIGTLPAIGDSECGHLCLCHFEYSDSVERPEMKPKKPKPEKPKTHKVTQYSELDALMADLREKLGKAGVKGLKINVSVEVGGKK